MAEKDLYKILGVNKDASKDEIKRAYKRLAKKYHPDLNKEEGSAEKFKEINEAASILGDDQKRQQYDQFGSSAFNGAGGSGGFGAGGFDFSHMRGGMGGFDFEDIFESFFGGGRSRTSRRRQEQQGADIRHDMSITLEEAAKGVEKEIKIRKRVTCSSCNGAGGHDVKTCPNCHGTGAVRQTKQTPFGVFATTSVCGSCGGTGQHFEKPCSHCDATGVVMETVTIHVKVPAGISDGVRLRMAHEGDAGLRGGPAGDLYVFISILEHKFFERDGSNLLLEVPLSFVQATLGDEIEVPTLFGKAKLKIPAGTQTGTVFRLAGKGLPELRSSHVGDQLVAVSVDVPKKLNKKQKEALNAFKKAMGDSSKPQKNLFEKIFS